MRSTSLYPQAIPLHVHHSLYLILCDAVLHKVLFQRAEVIMRQFFIRLEVVIRACIPLPFARRMRVPYLYKAEPLY